MKNPRLINLDGQRFGKWLVVRQAGNNSGGGALWKCSCECGTERSVLGQDLRKGKSKSCGCHEKKMHIKRITRHGQTGTRLYQCWQNMRRRCRSKNNVQYPDYGGRGIQIDEQWDDFATFAAWAHANGYRDDLSIEREDVNGNYTPSNCVWATAAVQSANRRFVKRAPDGQLWRHKALANGISNAAYASRVHAGWPMEQAVTHPMGRERVPRERDPVTGRFGS